MSIARWKFPLLSPEGDNAGSWQSWKGVYRTLVFMDCWLCFTMGYTTDNIHAHSRVAVDNESPRDTIENAIQYRAVKLAVIAAEISYSCRDIEKVDQGRMNALIGALEAWQQELPPELQMSSLTSSASQGMSVEQHKAMLSVHVLYFGAVGVLYRQFLLALDNDTRTGRWPLQVDRLECLKYKARCEMAAQHVTRALRLLKLDAPCTLRCWLTMYVAQPSERV